MWRFLFLLLCGYVVWGTAATAQDIGRPYGPFDAIAEGTRNSELRRLSLIDSQLDTVDRLRAGIVPVAQPRAWLRDPGVAAVVPYGRRGILGLRPQGYIVVRRAPVVANRPIFVPPSPPGALGGGLLANDPASAPIRQPIGHQSLQTGLNRWEYRPLYADDDRWLDETHREIERNLGLAGTTRDLRGTRSGDRAAVEPEELPMPGDAAEASRDRRPANDLGEARDIARSANFAADQKEPKLRDNVRVPPPPEPDPPQPQSNVRARSDEPRGPALGDPASGRREF
jgi:hypothetical protein